MVLSGAAFAHCLTVVEFLHGYGKVIGLNIPKDIPSLATLQEGLLGLGEGQGEVQDLMLKLLEAALHDPGLSSYYQVCGAEQRSVSQSVSQPSATSRQSAVSQLSTVSQPSAVSQRVTLKP